MGSVSSHPLRVSEGIDEEGQLYVRREWANSKFGLVEMQVPGDFTPQGWGPAHVPESSDTLEEVHAHLDQLVEDGILAAEERSHSAMSQKSPSLGCIVQNFSDQTGYSFS